MKALITNAAMALLDNQLTNAADKGVTDGHMVLSATAICSWGMARLVPLVAFHCPEKKNYTFVSSQQYFFQPSIRKCHHLFSHVGGKYFLCLKLYLS